MNINLPQQLNKKEKLNLPSNEASKYKNKTKIQTGIVRIRIVYLHY